MGLLELIKGSTHVLNKLLWVNDSQSGSHEGDRCKLLSGAQCLQAGGLEEDIGCGDSFEADSCLAGVLTMSRRENGASKLLVLKSSTGDDCLPAGSSLRWWPEGWNPCNLCTAYKWYNVAQYLRKTATLSAEYSIRSWALIATVK